MKRLSYFFTTPKKYGKAIIETNNELIKKLKVKNKQNLSDELRSAGSDVSLERSEVVYKKDFPWVKGVPVGAKVPALDALAASNVCQNKFASQNYNVSMK